MLLVQEHVDGIPATDPAAVAAAGLDRKLLAARGVDAFLKMILLDGFFHADPHPGNVFYLLGQPPGDHRLRHGRAALAAAARARSSTCWPGWCAWRKSRCSTCCSTGRATPTSTRSKLANDVNEMVFDYEGMPLKDIRVGNVIRQFAGIVREHSIVLPSDLSLMFKALITLEGLGRQYDPDFHIIDHLTPLVRSALSERYQPAELARRARSAVGEFMNVVGGVPRDFARLLREARRGKTRVDLDLKRLDSFGRQLDRTLDRVTMGIMTASLVIGSAIVLTVRDGPMLSAIPVLPALGLLGYVLAFLNSLWIVYGIWRAGRE